VDWARADATQDSPLKGYFDFPGMVKKWEAGQDEICRLAPHLVICHAPKRATTASIDGLVALAHLDVAAPAFGLATCWAGLFHLASLFWAPLREALALPVGNVPLYSMMLGYPATTYHRAPRRKRLTPEWR
jgi:nitroreductase